MSTTRWLCWTVSCRHCYQVHPTKRWPDGLEKMDEMAKGEISLFDSYSLSNMMVAEKNNEKRDGFVEGTRHQVVAGG